MNSECLVCTIVDRKVCLPIGAIQGILPLHCTVSVPCTERWVVGLGLRDNRVFTVVCPALSIAEHVAKSEVNAATEQRNDTRLDSEKMLLSRQTDMDMSWALRIQRVLGMATINVDMTRHVSNGEWNCPGDWFRPAQTKGGDEIVWLDPEAVNRSLTRVGGGR